MVSHGLRKEAQCLTQIAINLGDLAPARLEQVYSSGADSVRLPVFLKTVGALEGFQPGRVIAKSIASCGGGFDWT